MRYFDTAPGYGERSNVRRQACLARAFDRGALSVSAAAQGLGFALESTRFAEDELRSGELVRAGGGSLRDIPREVHFLCYRAAQSEFPKVSAFRRWLLAAIEEGEPM